MPQKCPGDGLGASSRFDLCATPRRPAKSKRGQEEGDGTETVVNCRKFS